MGSRFGLRTRVITCAAMLVVLTFGAAGLRAAPAGIAFEGAYTQPATEVGVVYGTFVNAGGFPDRLTGASSPLAKSVEMHRSMRVRATNDMDASGMHMTGSEMPTVMRMAPTPTVHVPPHDRLVLAPGGYHLMLMDLRRPLRPGDRVPLHLHFARAGDLDVVVPVRAF